MQRGFPVKLTAITMWMASAALSFGQTNLQIQAPAPSGTTRLSALSISRVGDDARYDNQDRLAALLRQRFSLTSVYTKHHPTVAAVQFEIDRLNAALASEKRIIQLRGNVEIRTDTIIFTADEANYHEDTGEIEARGNVRVKPVTPLVR
jgi:lipopolysaccharide assembly outer membrane protein LptD (OstA)